jgi:DNA-binding beta-propeller fold protein YncE
MRNVPLSVIALVAVLTVHAPAGAPANDCAQPITSGPGPTATDCLYILQAAVGSVVCIPECICAPKGSLPIAATDALLCLARATGQSVTLDCPCVTTTTSTTTTTLFTPADCGEFAAKIGVGKLTAPFGVAVDSNGNIYVADAGTSKIAKFGPAGAFVKSWGGTGSSDGKFFSEDPRGLAVGTGNRVYAGDTGNRRVQFFDSNGAFLGKWGSECFLSQGTGCVDPDGPGPLELGDGQFIEPYALATDSSGNVYVVDSSNYRVQVFDGDGAFLRKWPLTVVSRAIAVSETGDVLVGGDDQIFRYDGDGNLLDTFGGFCRLSDGAGCIDPDGDDPLEQGDGQWFQGFGMIGAGGNGVFVVDDGNGRVQWLAENGAFRAKWGSPCTLSDLDGCIDPDASGPLELGDGQFGGASGVAVHTSGDVLVAEAYNARVQRFDCPDLR